MPATLLPATVKRAIATGKILAGNMDHARASAVSLPLVNTGLRPVEWLGAKIRRKTIRAVRNTLARANTGLKGR